MEIGRVREEVIGTYVLRTVGACGFGGVEVGVLMLGEGGCVCVNWVEKLGNVRGSGFELGWVGKKLVMISNQISKHPCCC